MSGALCIWNVTFGFLETERGIHLLVTGSVQSEDFDAIGTYLDIIILLF